MQSLSLTLQLLLFLLVLFWVTTEARWHDTSSSFKTLQRWGIVQRGGGGAGHRQNQQQPVSVALLRSGAPPTAVYYHEDSTRYSCSAFKKDDDDIVETLAITSDVILITVEHPTTRKITTTVSATATPASSLDDLVDQIVRGAQRRRDAGYSKLAVIVVAISEDLTNEEEERWKDQLTSQHFSKMLPAVIGSLDIVSMKEAQATYQDVISDLQGGERMVTSVQQYEALIRQVYQSLNSKPCCDFGFEPAKESFFETSEKTSSHPSTMGRVSNKRQEIDPQILAEVIDELEKLELQQEEVWLNADSQVPLLHFGAAANSILVKAEKAVLDCNDDDRVTLLTQIAGGKLRELYQNQLQSLREHFGRKYEAALEEHAGNEPALTDAAARITEGFRAAAQHAIPEKCREGQQLVDVGGGFTYVAALQGLVSDMMEITSMVQEAYNDMVGDDDNIDESGKKAPAKWYQKLAARALMLGINYVQGWLAWQGVRKAAAQRDKDMPKFPLF